MTKDFDSLSDEELDQLHKTTLETSEDYGYLEEAKKKRELRKAGLLSPVRKVQANPFADIDSLFRVN